MQKIFSILVLIVCLMFVSGGNVIAGSEHQKEQGEAVKMSGVMEENSEMSQKDQEMKEEDEAVKEDKDISKEQDEAAEAAEMMEEKK